MKENSLRIKSYFRKVDSNEVDDLISSYKDEIKSGNNPETTYNKYSSEIKKKPINAYKLISFILFAIIIVCFVITAIYVLVENYCYEHQINNTIFSNSFGGIFEIALCTLAYGTPICQLLYFIFLIFRKIKFKESKLLFFLVFLCAFLAVLGFMLALSLVGMYGEKF